MIKRTILASLLFGILLSSCSHVDTNYLNANRDIASKGAVTGNSLPSACMKDLNVELDPIAISEKFKVELVRPYSKLLQYEARDLCLTRVQLFGSPSCSYEQPYQVQDKSGATQWKSSATPSITESFMRAYRKHIICNKIAECEQNASLDERTTANALDKIHRVFENFKCDSDTSEEAAVVKEEPRVVPAVAPVLTGVRRGAIQAPYVAPNVAPNPPVAKDPNAAFCPHRSTAAKCNELSGICVWSGPSAGFCKARANSNDPNAAFCVHRSGRQKCEELSGVCEWSGASSGYCQAR